MNGPNKNDREALGRRAHFRQTCAEIFGWLVGVGLLVEYWDELLDCVTHRHWPSRPLWGGMIVTGGVFLEVLLSRLSLITADELQKRADSDVAQANERAAQALGRAGKAEQAAAEATERTAHLRIEIADARERQAQGTPRRPASAPRGNPGCSRTDSRRDSSIRNRRASAA